MSKISKIKDMVRELSFEDLEYLLDYIRDYFHYKEMIVYREENNKNKLKRKENK